MKLPPVHPKSIQMYEGSWYRLDSPEITECCDCGLVHHTEYMFKNGRMFWRSAADPKATQAARKRLEIKIVNSGGRTPPRIRSRR